jgi:hypothetical protein
MMSFSEVGYFIASPKHHTQNQPSRWFFYACHCKTTQKHPQSLPLIFSFTATA